MHLESELAKIVGVENVIAHKEDLFAYVSSWHHGPPPQPMAVVFPANSSQVQHIVLLANEHKIPLSPVSSRVHLHQGSFPCPGGLVMDLRNLNRISHLDPRNRKVRIEPGVTWAQLHSFLADKDFMVPNPFFPHPDGSVLAALLDREPLLDPRFEAGEPIASMEFVWPTGKAFRTGTASHVGFGSSGAEGAYPYGPGPIDPLRLVQGAQGTMGVVTWANIRLQVRPPVDELYMIPLEHPEQIPPLVSNIQKRRIGRECLVLNKEMVRRTIGKILAAQGHQLGSILPPWMLITTISGGKWFPEEKIAYEKEALMEILLEAKVHTCNANTLGTSLDSGKIRDLLRSPWDEDLTYWCLFQRMPFKRFFFICPMDRSPLFINEVMRKTEGLGSVRLGIYIQPLEYGGASHLDLTFFTNGEEPQEEDLEGLLKSCVLGSLQLGAHFSRPHGKLLSKLVYENIDLSYVKLLREVKAVIDPNNIMNPDKLCFGPGLKSNHGTP